MALVKNKSRDPITDERLSALELLSVECDLLEKNSYDDIIDTFSAAKSRKCL